jgi:hypothetical protein
MTFGEKLSHVAKDDPKFARSVRRIRVASAVFGIAVVVAVAVALWSLAIGFSNKTQLTKIESPCLRYGAKSEQCKQAFEQAVLTITHPEACAILRKAGLTIAPCAHARLRQEHRRGKERAATSRRSGAKGGDAAQTGSTGHQQPSPSLSEGGGSGTEAGKGGGGQGAQPGQGGTGGPSAPAGGESDPAPAPASAGSGAEQSRETPAPTTNEGADPPEPHPLPETVEAAGGAVGETGEAVQGAVEGTGKAAGCVLRGSC